MARTERNIYYPDDYNEVADIPADLQTMAESIDGAIDGAVQEATYDDTALKARVTTNEGDIADIKSEQTTQNTNIQTNANAITSLQGTVQAQGQSIEGLSNNKVDKVQGKGLSTEDFETPEKAKLAGIEAEANKTIVDSSLDDTSTNPVQNKVIYESQEEQNAEIEVLQQDVEDLRGACLSVEGTGTDIRLNNTAQARLLKNELSGRTEQDGEPTPETPISIKNVTGNSNVKLQNKNLAWTGWAEDFVSRINNNYRAKIEIKDNRNCLHYGASAGYQDYDNKYIFKIPFKSNTQYTFVFDLASTNAKGNIAIEYTDGTTSMLDNLSINNWNKVIFTSSINKTIKYLRAVYLEGSTDIDLDTFMVLEGSYTAETIPSYVPHAEQNYPFTLGNIELNKIGTAQDYFYKTNNKWYLHKEIMKRTITNVNVVGTASSGIQYASMGSISNVKSNSFVYCPNYINSTDATKNNSIRMAVGTLIVYDNRFTDVETAQSLLNGLEYYHIMATPTNTEITDTTLISQLEAIKNARSYDDITYISSTSDELGFDMNVVAVADANKVIDNQNNEIDTIKSRLDLLEG